MALGLSQKEQEMLAAVIKEMGGIPEVNFQKVAEVTGHKYHKNARSAFKRIWNKLGDGGNSFGVKRKSSTKTTPKKSAGPKKAPRKASAKAPAARRNFKKEESQEIDEISNADEFDDEVAVKFEGFDEGDSDKGDGDSRDEDQIRNTNDGSEVDEDEAGAHLLGVPLDEYKELAKEVDHRAYAPTPPHSSIKDNDEAGTYLPDNHQDEDMKLTEEAHHGGYAPTPQHHYTSDDDAV